MVSEIKYPYWVSGLITDPAQVFDRERAKARLRLYLTKGISCQIVGPPSIGKSSLLYNLQHFAREWDPTAKVAYLDLQSEECRTVSDVYTKAAEAWGVGGQHAKDEAISKTVKELSKGGLRVVLCLDEFARIVRRPDEFTIDFFLGLRSLGQSGLTIFTSTRQVLHELIPAYNPTSPFFNIFALLRIGLFSDEDAAAFVDVPREGVPPFSYEEKSAILSFAKGHPLALQIACLNVLFAKQNGEGLTTALAMANEDMQARLGRNGPENSTTE
jgi:hypothetical protein